jgi:CBS-domain-containing membrane protein
VSYVLSRSANAQQADVPRRLIELAKRRVDVLRTRLEIGQAEALDVKRAEIELLEQTIELQALERRLSELGARGRGKGQ